MHGQRYDSLLIGLGRFEINALRPHRGPLCGSGPQIPERLQTPEMGMGLELVPFFKSIPTLCGGFRIATLLHVPFSA